MMWGDQPWLSTAALIEYCGVGQSDGDVASLLGVNRRVWVRHKAAGRLRLHTAEKYAHRLGAHPLEVWGADYRDAVEQTRSDDDDD